MEVYLVNGLPAVRVPLTAYRVVDRKWIGVEVVFSYDPADPYAVGIDFGEHPQADAERIVWATERDLLLAGFRRRVGIGDIRFWPCRGSRTGAHYIAMAVSSPEGTALFMIPRAAIAAFVRRTLEVVPAGAESEYFNVDGELTKFLRQQ